MTQAAKRTSTKTRRTGDGRPTVDGHGPHSEQDLVGHRDRDDDTDRDDRTERDERDPRREQELTGDRDDRGPRDARGEQGYGDRNEHGVGREHGDAQRTVEQLTDQVRAATSQPVNAFAGTPDMSKVVTAWIDMVGDMMKLQQQFFATVLDAGNTNDRPTTKV